MNTLAFLVLYSVGNVYAQVPAAPGGGHAGGATAKVATKWSTDVDDLVHKAQLRVNETAQVLVTNSTTPMNDLDAVMAGFRESKLTQVENYRLLRKVRLLMFEIAEENEKADENAAKNVVVPERNGPFNIGKRRAERKALEKVAAVSAATTELQRNIAAYEAAVSVHDKALEERDENEKSDRRQAFQDSVLKAHREMMDAQTRLLSTRVAIARAAAQNPSPDEKPETTQSRLEFLRLADASRNLRESLEGGNITITVAPQGGVPSATAGARPALQQLPTRGVNNWVTTFENQKKALVPRSEETSVTPGSGGGSF